MDPGSGPSTAPSLAAWVGRSEVAVDTLDPRPVAALRATLDLPGLPVEPGQVLPPLWHWLYFLPLHRASELGPDGHARRGGFLPPLALPRRMWAGGRFEFRHPLRVGDRVERVSTIERVDEKRGRSGALAFVTVRHELRREGEAEEALTEWHDIVYREATRPGELSATPQAAPSGAAWQRDLVPDAVLLFRYSALTFNGHRIHYDRHHAMVVEGYPGLVVHGPLVATLLLDLLHRHAPDADLAGFVFRALRPAFDERALRLCALPQGHSVRLWAQDGQGALLMDAEALLR
jgi:3-methylfumaryl-CoA hydratase